MIEIKGLTKKYHSKRSDVTALNSIDLELPNTGFVAIYGENGCGKTTLLNILSTADTRYEGKITYNNINYREIVPELQRNVISFVLQEKYFIPYLNLYENIELFSEEENSKLIYEKMTEFAILDKKDKSASNLSGGQRQRASIIRGIIKNSEILLVDEPTSSLNEEMEHAVFLRLQEYAKEKLVVLVSHNIRLIRTFADLIIHMDKGKILSVENNLQTDIQYIENEVLIPPNFYNLSALDASFVKISLDQHHSIIINQHNSATEKTTKLDYGICSTHTKWKPSKKLSSRIKNKLIISSLKHTKANIIFGICLVSLFAIMINFLFSFAFFDQYEFVYQSLDNNIDGYINYRYNPSIYENMSNIKLNLSSYLQYEKSFPTPKLLLVDYEAQPELQFDSSGIYTNTIFGISFCKENGVNLVCGDFCQDGEILLTDYCADALINNSQEYTDHESIIEHGVIINGTLFDVAGIIDTDYEKYKSLYFDDSFINSQAYIDYQNSIKNLYSRIYYSLDQYLSCDQISYLSLEYGNLFCNANSIEKNSHLFVDINLSDSCCYINETLHNIIGDVDTIKINNTYLTVTGVINDSKDQNNIYLPQKALETLKISILGDVEALMTDLSSPEEVSFLMNNNMTHNTSISTYINKVIEIITLTSNIFLFLLILLTVFLLTAIIFLVNKAISSDNTTIALLKSGGYSAKSIWLLEIRKITIIYILSCIISSTLYITASYLTNNVLSNLFGFNINISLIDIKTISVTILIMFMIFVFVTTLIILLKNRKRIVDLINP